MKINYFLSLLLCGLAAGQQISASEAQQYRKPDLEKMKKAFECTESDIVDAARTTLAANIIAKAETTGDDEKIDTTLSPRDQAKMQYIKRAHSNLTQVNDELKKSCSSVTKTSGKDAKSACDRSIDAFREALYKINGGLYLK